jgi:hypothetical protein
MIDAKTDSRDRERRRQLLEDEKIEFFTEIERGKLVLGDALLHIAAQLGQTEVLDFLFLTDSPAPPPPTAASVVGSRLQSRQLQAGLLLRRYRCWSPTFAARCLEM